MGYLGRDVGITTPSEYMKCLFSLPTENESRVKRDDRLAMEFTDSQKIALSLLAKIKENPASPSIIEAIYAVRMQYNPKKNLNKFLVGTAVEQVLVELIRTCGYECTNVASTETIIDILVHDAERTFPFSLKSIRKLGSAVILENYRGQKREIKDLAPTIIAVVGDKELTLAYVDNDLVLKSGVALDSVYTHADSNLSMKGKFVKAMIKHPLSPDFVIQIPVPEMPALPEEDIAALLIANARASLAAARQAQ